MARNYFCNGAKIKFDDTLFNLHRKIGDEWTLVDLGTGKYSNYSLFELQGKLQTGELVFVNGDALTVNQADLKTKQNKEFKERFDELDEKGKLKVKRKKYYVDAVMDLPSTESLLTEVVKAAAVKIGDDSPPCCRTVLRWKAQYLAAGEVVVSLIDHSYNRGNNTDRFPKETIEIVEAVIDEVYMCMERGTIKDTFERAKAEVIWQNDLRPDATKITEPSISLVDRLIKDIPEYEKCIARYGWHEAQRQYRASLNMHGIKRPLEVVECDHTQLDTIVIDEHTGKILGRPWLTVMMDVYTRCVLGVLISMEPPSYTSVVGCLKFAVFPKTHLKAMYPGLKNEWVPFGLMTKLRTDNGPEFHGFNFEMACLQLGISISYTRAYSPWEKGAVERFNGDINRKLMHKIPGTTFSGIGDKVDYDPVKNARYTCRQIEEFVIRYVVDTYHTRIQSKNALSPNQLWNSSIDPSEIPLPFSIDQFDGMVKISTKRSLDHRGVIMHGLRYNSADLTNQIRKKAGDRVDVTVRWQEDDLSYVEVSLLGEIDFYRADCINTEYAKGLTLYQHERNQSAQRAQYASKNDGQSELNHQQLLKDAQAIGKPKKRKPVRVKKVITEEVPDILPTPEDVMHMEVEAAIQIASNTVIQNDETDFPKLVGVSKPRLNFDKNN